MWRIFNLTANEVRFYDDFEQQSRHIVSAAALLILGRSVGSGGPDPVGVDLHHSAAAAIAAAT
jgi:hypothetical protein